MDVRDYLTSKGLNVKQATATELHLACMFCGEDETKRGRLYINQDPPFFYFCHICGAKGTLKQIQRFYGDEVESDEYESSYTSAAIWNKAAEYCFNCLGDREDVIVWLTQTRGLTVDTIEKHQLGWANGTLGNYLRNDFKPEEIQRTGLIDRLNRDFLFSHVTIPYHMKGQVMYIRGKDMGGKYLTPAGVETRLFNSDITWNPEIDTFLVTEGELDCLVAEQLGYAAVGSPGAKVWQSSWSGYFETAKRVYVVFDGDNAGRGGADKVALSIGPKARIVEMPEETDITDYIVRDQHQKEDFDSILMMSRGGFLVTVRQAYEEMVNVDTTQGVKFGYKHIDRDMDKGLLPWQILVILAKTNAGKTLFTENVFHRMTLADPNTKILFVSLEQTRSEWFKRTRNIYRFYDLDATEQEVIDYWEPKIMLIDKNRVSDHELMQNVEQFQYEMGDMPSLIAVDYLGYWARSFKGDGYERTTSAIMAMKALSKEYRIPFLTPHQVNRAGARHGEEFEIDAGKESGAVEETADFIWQLVLKDQSVGRRDADRTGELSVRMGKSRSGVAGAKYDFILAPKSGAIIPTDDPLVDRARLEVRHWRLPYDEVMDIHKTGKKARSYYSDG